MKNLYTGFIVLFLIAFAVTFFMGINKMYVYENPASSVDESFYSVEDEYDEEDIVNAYVEGDAYNYIINAGKATALFVLSGVFLLASIGIGILSKVAELLPKTVAREKELTNT